MKKFIKLFTNKLDSFQESRFIFAQLNKRQVQSLQKAADSINEKNSEQLQGKKKEIKELTKQSLTSLSDDTATTLTGGVEIADDNILHKAGTDLTSYDPELYVANDKVKEQRLAHATEMKKFGLENAATKEKVKEAVLENFIAKTKTPDALKEAFAKRIDSFIKPFTAAFVKPTAPTDTASLTKHASDLFNAYKKLPKFNSMQEYIQSDKPKTTIELETKLSTQYQEYVTEREAATKLKPYLDKAPNKAMFKEFKDLFESENPLDQKQLDEIEVKNNELSTSITISVLKEDIQTKVQYYKDNPPTIVINATEIIISIPGIAKGK